MRDCVARWNERVGRMASMRTNATDEQFLIITKTACEAVETQLVSRVI